MDQVVDPNNAHGVIEEAYRCTLAESFRNRKCSYERSMMTMWLSPVVNFEGATSTSAVHNIHDKKLLRHGYCTLIRDERHRRHSVKILSDEEGVSLAVDPSRMHYESNVRRKDTSPGYAIKLGQIKNIPTTILRREAKLTDTMKSMLIYA